MNFSDLNDDQIKILLCKEITSRLNRDKDRRFFTISEKDIEITRPSQETYQRWLFVANFSDSGRLPFKLHIEPYHVWRERVGLNGLEQVALNLLNQAHHTIGSQCTEYLVKNFPTWVD